MQSCKFIYPNSGARNAPNENLFRRAIAECVSIAEFVSGVQNVSMRSTKYLPSGHRNLAPMPELTWRRRPHELQYRQMTLRWRIGSDGRIYCYIPDHALLVFTCTYIYHFQKQAHIVGL